MPEGLSRREFLAGAMGFGAAGEAEAARRKADLRGSKESMDRQNQEANEHNLSRIKNRQELEKMIEQGYLVKLPEDKNLQIDPSLPEWRRYCRPWTRDFLADLGGHTGQNSRTLKN